MSERDDLMQKLQQVLISYNIPPEELRSRLYLTLEPYEITQRSTELVVGTYTCNNKTVIENYMPTEDYFWCDGEMFIRREYEK